MSERATAICVLAAKPRDAVATRDHLTEVGLEAFCLESFSELDDVLSTVGAVMITEDAVPAHGWISLGAWFERQPAWSDLPVIVFSGQRQVGLDALLASGAGNLTVIEMPARASTVISAAQTAMRARRRQYEVRDLLVRLEDTDRRKDEFLAMLGHELRNPIGAMQLAIQVTQMQSPKPLDRQNQVMQRQLRNLGRIVDDLLDVSRVTLGKIQLEHTQVDLCESARRCVQAHANDAERSKLALRIVAPEHPVFVQGDAVRLEQVLTNLVTNAIKYTPAGGGVEVTVQVVGQRVRVTVRDNGIGVDPAILPDLFDLFIQAKQGLDRSRGGLGLGLALVRRLVELHGGTVGATSEGLGRGAAFWFELPISMHVVVEPAARDAITTRPLRVLIVEDNDDAREMLRELLVAQGHDVVTAADGLDGLQHAIEREPDVLLVDIGLPSLDGHEIARHIRSTHRFQPWMIAMTGYGQPTDRERALAAGFDMFVVKPVDLHELERAVARCATARADS